MIENASLSPPKPLSNHFQDLYSIIRSTVILVAIISIFLSFVTTVILTEWTHSFTFNDELNILEPNRNFGWPNVQGFCNLPTETGFCSEYNVVEPLTAWTPTIAPSDILWYDHPSIPEFQNTLLMTVLKDKMLVRFEFSEDGRTVTNETEFFNQGKSVFVCFTHGGHSSSNTCHTQGASYG